MDTCKLALNDKRNKAFEKPKKENNLKPWNPDGSLCGYYSPVMDTTP